MQPGFCQAHVGSRFGSAVAEASCGGQSTQPLGSPSRSMPTIAQQPQRQQGTRKQRRHKLNSSSEVPRRILSCSCYMQSNHSQSATHLSCMSPATCSQIAAGQQARVQQGTDAMKRTCHPNKLTKYVYVQEATSKIVQSTLAILEKKATASYLLRILVKLNCSELIFNWNPPPPLLQLHISRLR